MASNSGDEKCGIEFSFCRIPRLIRIKAGSPVKFSPLEHCSLSLVFLFESTSGKNTSRSDTRTTQYCTEETQYCTLTAGMIIQLDM